MSSSRSNFSRYLSVSALALFVSACQPGEMLNSITSSFGSGTQDATPEAAQSVAMIERDVEAPEVYDRTDPGLWDGRPSLGGVWIAAPNVTDPERVIIRNTTNDKFVIGALFRRERTNPGPPMQLSSDAAAALGILAGAPTEVSVIALRREEMPDPAAVTLATDATGAAAPVDAIEATSLDDPIAAAAAALDRAEAASVAAGVPAPRPTATEAATVTTTPAAGQTALTKPFLQVGIFSIEQNARNTATALRGAGIVPTVLAQESAGKAFWRVVVGPASTRADRAAVLSTIKDLGYEDAYPVTN